MSAEQVQPDLKGPMNALAGGLAKILKPYGFALLVFPFDEPVKGRMNYISNASREDMIVAMKEFIAKHEGRSPETPEGKQ